MAAMRALFALLLLCELCAASEDDGHDEHGHEHEHGHGAFEWAGIFEVPDDVYMWTAQKIGGSYADATMKIAVLPATKATNAALEALEPEGEHALEANCTEVEAYGRISPQEDACYVLHFDGGVWQSLYKVDTSSVAAVAFFTEHMPTEFENNAHYLKDSAGEDVEPQAEHPAKSEESTEGHAEWGASFLAAVIVNLVTLAGVIFVVPFISSFAASHAATFEGALCSFASGALIACAVFLMLVEGSHLVGEGWSEETAIIWRWGTMVLLGFFLPMVFDGITALLTESHVKVQDCQTETTAHERLRVNTNSRSKVRILSAVMMGDFLHNLCDGFFIGAAFKGCGVSFGWGVTLATALHELPQELADYAVLTGSSVGLRPWLALLLNFLAGLSVIIGVLIINGAEVDNPSVGMLLAFGGGVYVYVAAVECMPKLQQLQLPAKATGLCAGCFVLGAILIGLILLDHEHCVPGSEDGHGGHDHGHHH